MRVLLHMCIVISLAIAFIYSFTGCAAESARPLFDSASAIKTYRDIPNVIAEEIAAIEAFKSSGRFFSFGAI